MLSERNIPCRPQMNPHETGRSIQSQAVTPPRPPFSASVLPSCPRVIKPYIGCTKPYVRLDRRDASFSAYVHFHPPRLPNIPNPYWHVRLLLSNVRTIALKNDQPAFCRRRQAVDLLVPSTEHRPGLCMKHRPINNIIPCRCQDLAQGLPYLDSVVQSILYAVSDLPR